MVNPTPTKEENTVVRSVGKIISVGDALPMETRMAMMDAGISCKEVAFRTKNIAEAYSACSVLSKRLAALMP